VASKWPDDPDSVKLSDEDRKQPVQKEIALAFGFRTRRPEDIDGDIGDARGEIGCRCDARR